MQASQASGSREVAMALEAEALLSRAVRLAHPLRVHLHWFSTVIELDMQAEDVPQRAGLLAVEVK